MSNRIFDELLLQQFRRFQSSFRESKNVFFDEETKKLRHPGEFGIYREEICRKFLKFFVPSRLEIGQGFLINSNDEVSTQCDIVIYDSRNTPLIQTSEQQRFFPVESVCAIGEVKSILKKQDLSNALNKLAKIKRLSEFVRDASIGHKTIPGPYDPHSCIYDQKVTFLICQKFDFELRDVNELYDSDVEYRHRHNLILSLDNGVMLYSLGDNQPEDGMHIYPVMQNRQLRDAIMKPETSKDDYMRIFAHYMFLATSNATILVPDICNYMIYPEI